MVLSKAEEHPGFTDALLDILQAEQEAPVRLSSTPSPSLNPAVQREILTVDYSRRLPEEPRYQRMVTERGLATQTYTRR
jgi:hypothetical protein